MAGQDYVLYQLAVLPFLFLLHETFPSNNSTKFECLRTVSSSYLEWSMLSLPDSAQVI